MSKVTQIPVCASLILVLAGLTLAKQPVRAQEIKSEIWGSMPDGKPVRKFILTNAHGTRVVLAELGALLVSIETASQEGSIGRITLSYSSLEEAAAGGVYGSVIGRFANRISGGGFTIDGERYDLTTFNPKTGVHIHGGATGFQRQVWNGTSGTDSDGTFVEFTLESGHGHEGYPGTVQVSATYRLTADNVLRIEYRGTTDRPTHLNLTNHAYFNLAGSGSTLDHELEMTCDTFLEIDEKNIPTGKRLTVEGGPFDFRKKKRIGKDILRIEGGGYDHCFVIPEFDPAGTKIPVPFAKLRDPSSGRTMEVATTTTGVQIYTANHLKGDPFPKWGGICFETQYFPDTPNQPGFPSSLLRPGETYHEITEFRFGVE